MPELEEQLFDFKVVLDRIAAALERCADALEEAAGARDEANQRQSIPSVAEQPIWEGYQREMERQPAPAEPNALERALSETDLVVEQLEADRHRTNQLIDESRRADEERDDAPRR
jgi:hypothetical protein